MPGLKRNGCYDVLPEYVERATYILFFNLPEEIKS